MDQQKKLEPAQVLFEARRKSSYRPRGQFLPDAMLLKATAARGTVVRHSEEMVGRTL